MIDHLHSRLERDQDIVGQIMGDFEISLCNFDRFMFVGLMAALGET